MAYRHKITSTCSKNTDITIENISNTGTPSTEGEGDNGQHARELSKRFCDEAFRQIVGDTSSTISIYKFSSWFRGAAIPPQVDRTTAIQIKRRLAGIEDEKDIPVVVRNETVSTKNSIKQWVDYDVSPAKCTPHVLPPSHTSAPFGLDDQPPTKEPLAFDRVYDTRFDGKDTESHVVLGMLSSFNFLFSHFNHSLTNRFIRHGQTGRDASSEEENASSELTPGSETHAK